jgi:hypothetical protein
MHPPGRALVHRADFARALLVYLPPMRPLSDLETLLQERITAQTSAEARLEETDRMTTLLLDQIATLQDAVRSLASRPPQTTPAPPPSPPPGNKRRNRARSWRR